ncbi:hypothetical protein Tco_1111072 [Tanacetum coccineum]|uniref:Uncharacterized protein n=1 Tax=Tanacetum coccineum TaxID=301880 RepID=A0ABQ5IN72_9ASTR
MVMLNLEDEDDETELVNHLYSEEEEVKSTISEQHDGDGDVDAQAEDEDDETELVNHLYSEEEESLNEAAMADVTVLREGKQLGNMYSFIKSELRMYSSYLKYSNVSKAVTL